MSTSRFISRSTILSCLIALLAAAGLLACTQTEGETCQVNSDCEDGLVCSRESRADRGACIRRDDAVDPMGDPEEDPELPPDPPITDPEDDAGAQQAGASG
jgi:hypothetical protein